MVGREVVHWCYLTSGLELRLSSDVRKLDSYCVLSRNGWLHV